MSSNLPQELIIEILSRIPIKDVCTCKCVCKSWLNLLETHEFISSHLSKSVPRLLVSHRTVFQFFDFEQCSHPKTKKSSNNLGDAQIECSIDGLIFFQKFWPKHEYYVCNPLTREYVKLPKPQATYDPIAMVTYGFGISRNGREYKVVRMLEKLLCQVYTLGGRTWRSIAGNDERLSVYSKGGTFLNGNLHWLVKDLEGSWWVSCFDLETEAFTKFRAPTSTVKSESRRFFIQDIGVLRGCLCLCDYRSQFVLYTMSCYEKKIWVRECVIRKSSGYPIKVFGDSNGGVLMALHDQDGNLFCYSNNTNERTHLMGSTSQRDHGFQALSYTPSFVSLGGF